MKTSVSIVELQNLCERVSNAAERFNVFVLHVVDTQSVINALSYADKVCEAILRSAGVPADNRKTEYICSPSQMWIAFTKELHTRANLEV